MRYIKQKQQQKQQLQSLLPPELATLDTPLGGLRIIKGGATFNKGLRVMAGEELCAPRHQDGIMRKARDVLGTAILLIASPNTCTRLCFIKPTCVFVMVS